MDNMMSQNLLDADIFAFYLSRYNWLKACVKQNTFCITYSTYYSSNYCSLQLSFGLLSGLAGNSRAVSSLLEEWTPTCIKVRSTGPLSPLRPTGRLVFKGQCFLTYQHEILKSYWQQRTCLIWMTENLHRRRRCLCHCFFCIIQDSREIIVIIQLEVKLTFIITMQIPDQWSGVWLVLSGLPGHCGHWNLPVDSSKSASE